MKHGMRRASQVALLAVFVGGVASVASAAPICNFNVDFTGSGQMLVDVYGTDVPNGSDAVTQAANAWDPISFGSSSGYTYDGMAVFGTDTADPGDDFVRYWFSRTTTDTTYHWAMTNDAPAVALAPADAIPNPEPGSMVLLGSGLLGLAAVARKRFQRA